MPALYSEHTCDPVNQKLKLRLIILFSVAALLLAVFIWALVARIEWLAMAAATLAGCFAVFFTDMLCMPLVRYRRMVQNALTGRHREKTMEFARLEPDLSSVDGVSCRSLIFLGDPDKHGSRDMLLYWDREIPLPELEPGAFYAVQYTGKTIIALDRADPSSRP